MDSVEFREQIRINYAIGRRQAESVMALVKTDEDRHFVELEAAQRMLEPKQDDLAYSLNQGYWHIVGVRPLSIVNLELQGVQHV